MEIIGNRRFVQIPGDRTHELPPLLVRSHTNYKRLDKVMEMAADIIDSEDLLSEVPLEDPSADMALQRRKMDLAVNLVEQYLGLVRQWHWGDSVLEWIRQCEITFAARQDLRHVLQSDVWPHAGRSSFVSLLTDKAVPTSGVQLDKAVGLRLTFRQPPPIRCFSNQFLFYLNGSVATTAYQTWAQMSPDPVSFLPPERFSFDVVTM